MFRHSVLLVCFYLRGWRACFARVAWARRSRVVCAIAGGSKLLTHSLRAFSGAARKNAHKK
jgi:hypothetical protein